MQVIQLRDNLRLNAIEIVRHWVAASGVEIIECAVDHLARSTLDQGREFFDADLGAQGVETISD